MPATRRHLGFVVLLLLVGAAAVWLWPDTLRTRVLRGLAEGVAQDEAFPLARASDFAWTRVCAVPAGAGPAVAAALLEVPYPLVLEADASALLFVDANGAISEVRLGPPDYAGTAACFDRAGGVTVAPLPPARGRPRFRLEQRP